MRSLDVVLLDWDGTVVDSAETSFRCYVRLFGKFGLAFDREQYRRTYSPNWHRTYTEIGLAPEHWEEADRSWFPIYCEEKAELVSGAREALARLSSAGLRLGIVTSGGRPRVEWEIGEHGLGHRFETVVYGDDARERKPHPEALLLALGRLRVHPDRAAYVGDSPEDVEMARAAGALSVGIPGGFPNQEALRASAPDLLAPDLGAAADVLAALCSGGVRP